MEAPGCRAIAVSPTGRTPHPEAVTRQLGPGGGHSPGGARAPLPSSRDPARGPHLPAGAGAAAGARGRACRRSSPVAHRGPPQARRPLCPPLGPGGRHTPRGPANPEKHRPLAVLSSSSLDDGSVTSCAARETEPRLGRGQPSWKQVSPGTGRVEPEPPRAAPASTLGGSRTGALGLPAGRARAGGVGPGWGEVGEGLAGKRDRLPQELLSPRGFNDSSRVWGALRVAGSHWGGGRCDFHFGNPLLALELLNQRERLRLGCRGKRGWLAQRERGLGRAQCLVGGGLSRWQGGVAQAGQRKGS